MPSNARHNQTPNRQTNDASRFASPPNRVKLTHQTAAVKRMIRVITFDFYNTLVKFWPPLEEIQQGSCRKLGLTLSHDALRRGYAQADLLFNRANEEHPLALRSPQQRLEFFAQYEQLILETAGVPRNPRPRPPNLATSHRRPQRIRPLRRHHPLPANPPATRLPTRRNHQPPRRPRTASPPRRPA